MTKPREVSRGFFFALFSLVLRRGPGLAMTLSYIQSRSNSAIDSTCDVCGNMFTTPAPFSR
jgi:hypothetical protein